MADGNITVTLSTYCWVIYNDIGQLVYESPPPADIKTDFSLHMHDPTITHVLDIKENQKFIIYPNPASDYCHLSFTIEQSTNAEIQLFNLSGQPVIYVMPEQELAEGNHLLSINTSILANGIYMVNFRSENTNITRKLVVAH